MGSASGLHRLVAFSDAVVAIAITLLILPLVDSASGIGHGELTHFVDDHGAQFLAFGLSFAVIGSFWWSHHQMLEHVIGYNGVLIGGMFVWILAIVFLPFPTELLSAASRGGQGVHGLYVGTMLVAALGVLAQEWAIVHWPELQDPEYCGEAELAPAVILVVLMATVLLLVVAVPALGLWSLFLLLADRPLQRAARPRRRRD